MHERAEIVGPGYEVGLAVHLDERANASTGMNVAIHDPLAGLAACLLGYIRQAPLFEKLLGIARVTTCLLQRALAIHDACAGAVAELLDLFSAHHHVLLPLANLLPRS